MLSPVQKVLAHHYGEPKEQEDAEGTRHRDGNTEIRRFQVVEAYPRQVGDETQEG